MNGATYADLVYFAFKRLKHVIILYLYKKYLEGNI
jgi:hypothetical protein